MNGIYILDTGVVFDERHAELLRFVSEERKAKIDSCRFDKDKLHCLYSELLVRAVAGQTLGLQPTWIIFGTGEYGKPFIKGFESFCYNVSHTGGTVVLAVSDSKVGVDAEVVRGAKENIAKRCFTGEEREYSGSNSEKFYEIWTKKEAYIKYFGKGISSMPPGSFCVLQKGIADNFRTYRHGDVIVSVYTDNPDCEFTVTVISEQEITKML